MTYGGVQVSRACCDKALCRRRVMLYQERVGFGDGMSG